MPRTPRTAKRAQAAPAAEPPNRRQNILHAAERLFAAHGFHGVSLRDIAEEAGVPLALVGYYFGPKLDLYQAIFRERAGYVMERMRLLAEIERAAPPARRLEEIVKAFVLPMLAVAADPRGHDFLRLMARGMSIEQAEDQAVVRELFDPLAHAFIDALCAAVPGAGRGTMAWCYQFALGALLHHATDTRVERLSRGDSVPGDFERSGPLLVAFITHGIRGACAAPRH